MSGRERKKPIAALGIGTSPLRAHAHRVNIRSRPYWHGGRIDRSFSSKTISGTYSTEVVTDPFGHLAACGALRRRAAVLLLSGGLAMWSRSIVRARSRA